jgi:curved DNA-binding protein CbpA
MDGKHDAYRLLQVDPEAQTVVIQAAYRALARIYHPDGPAPDSIRMALLNRAYAVLRDPVERGRYDARREAARVRAVPVGAAPQRVEVGVPRSRPAAEAAVLDFGRYAGWRIVDLARHDPDYLRWLSRHSSGLRFRNAIQEVLPPEPDLVRRSNSVA